MMQMDAVTERVDSAPESDTSENISVDEDFPFHKAVQNADTAAILNLLTSCPQYVNQKNDENETPLMTAIYERQVTLVELLLDHGADQTIDNDVWCCIHIAVDRNLEDIVDVLIGRGVDVNIPTKSVYSPIYSFGLSKNSTPLHTSLMNSGNNNMVYKLLEAGARLDIADSLGNNILDRAVDLYIAKNVRRSWYQRNRQPQEKANDVLEKMRILISAGAFLSSTTGTERLVKFESYLLKYNQCDFIQFLWTTGYKFCKAENDLMKYNYSPLGLKDLVVNKLRQRMKPNAWNAVLTMIFIPDYLRSLIINKEVTLDSEPVRD